VSKAKVSLERIDTFLNEPEVDDQISLLKKGIVNGSTASGEEDIAPLGFKKASFRWNSTELAKSAAKPCKKPSSHVAEEDSISVVSADVEAVRFELRDITVTFPQGKLTVVTGPTASGKTALMVNSSLVIHEACLTKSFSWLFWAK
jgi:ABC-type multidrug transport system fused ATPase/permease subunit